MTQHISFEQQRDIAIILPAHNEAVTVVQTMCSFHEALPYARIYVVDNNSSDNTYALAKNAFAEYGIDGAVLKENRLGKGNAVRRAFLEVEAEVYLLADADCTYPANQAIDLVLPIFKGEADMVLGDRFSQGDYDRGKTRPLHSIGNNIVTKLVNALGSSSLVDAMTGYRALSRAFVHTYPLLVEGFQLETDISLFAAQGRFRYREIPIRYVDRPQGSFSKLSTVHDGLRVLLAIFRIARHYRPLFFFSVLSVFFAMLGLLVGVSVLVEFFQTGYITKVPSVIAAAAFEIIAAILFSVGLILDGLAFQRRMYFEKNIIEQSKARYQKHMGPFYS